MFSVITPTYNRAHTLERVYSSLQSQTDQDFEWIIMDDASTDETEELVNSWLEKPNPFSIQYHKLPANKGKPNALNEGFQYCTRPITVIADSDDTFISKTIAELKMLWNTVNLSENANKIASIWTLVDDEQGQLVGEPFPYNFWQVNYKQRVLERKKQVAGEKWHSWRSDILKKYKMFHNDNAFVSEAASWRKINKDYDFLCINLIQRKYYTSPDGLIQKKVSRLKTEKQNHYFTYYHLYDTSILELLKFPFYRRYCFEYIKSLFFYNDKHLNLSLSKLTFICLLAFIHLPSSIIWHLKK